jgi:BCD family chlorophyll transporter-like MFS transporter
MKLAAIFRLGLRQFAAGMLSVVVLGILNRVMKVELGVELGLISLVLSAHYFAAPLAIPLGHRSDYRPYRGYHRTPYIAAGTALTALTAALAPLMALFIADRAGHPLAVAAGVALFLLMGAGMYTAGTAYLSLVTDRTQPEERGRAVSIIWGMMMLGILGGVFLGTRLLAHYTPEGLVALHVVVAGLVAVLTAVAVWGQERPRAARPSEEALSLGQAARVLTASRQTRLFFAFMSLGLFFIFLQQVVLEPFGGDVFGLNVAETTLFNAYQMVGVLAGMGLAGGLLVKRLGKAVTAELGAAMAAGAFALLSGAAVSEQVSLVRPAIFVMGLGMGFFNVGGLSLMMGLTAEGKVGLFMGAWTLAQALANGFSGVGGGVLHDLGLALSGAEPVAYALVFAVEAAGLLGMILVLRQVDVEAFRREVAWLSNQPS